MSAYAYNRTIMMEQRSKILREMNLSKREKEVVVSWLQFLIDVVGDVTSC